MKRNLNIKKKKRLNAGFAVTAWLIATVVIVMCNPMDGYAYTKTSGVISDGPVQLRESPVDGNKITSVPAGNTISVVDETTGSDGKLWYKVQVTYQGKVTTGYMRSDFITLSGAHTEEENVQQEDESADNPAQETPDNGMQDILPEVPVTINDVVFYLSNGFTEEQIPADFSEITVNFRGNECRGLSYNKGTVILIYMETDNVDESVGRFFIYDEANDTVYDFVKLTAGESSYVIALSTPDDEVLPDNYEQVALLMPENTQITAYQFPAEGDGGFSDFYIFYGVNHNGEEGWYQYDSSEATYQRVRGEFTDTADSDSDDLILLQGEYEELLQKYKDAKSFSGNMTAALIFVIAVASVIFFNIFLFGRKKGKAEDDELDGGAEIEKKPGKAVKQERPEKKKSKETGKKDETSVKNEKELEVFDLNDL